MNYRVKEKTTRAESKNVKTDTSWAKQGLTLCEQ